LDAIVSQKALNTKCAVNCSAVLVNKTKIHFTKMIMFCTQKFVDNSIHHSKSSSGLVNKKVFWLG